MSKEQITIFRKQTVNELVRSHEEFQGPVQMNLNWSPAEGYVIALSDDDNIGVHISLDLGTAQQLYDLLHTEFGI